MKKNWKVPCSKTKAEYDLEEWSLMFRSPGQLITWKMNFRNFLVEWLLCALVFNCKYDNSILRKISQKIMAQEITNEESQTGTKRSGNECCLWVSKVYTLKKN